jgi:hypothetical protein
MPAFEISPGPREMSREELARFRRGELSTAEAVSWRERTRGLDAPAPPIDGDLPPNGAGWLLGVKPMGGRLHPSLPLHAIACAAAGALLAACAGAFASHHPPVIMAALLGALVPLCLVFGLELAARQRTRRQFAQGTSATRLADVDPGSVVSLIGVIAARPAVPSLFRGVPAVLFRDCVHNADEVRGIDFELELEDGEAHVCVRRAFLVDRPTRTTQAPACGPVYAEPAAEGFGARLRSALLIERSPLFRTLGARYESSVGPGDRVEVSGVLHHELAPDDTAPFGRSVPARFVLRAPAGRPLLVRSLG